MGKAKTIDSEAPAPTNAAESLDQFNADNFDPFKSAAAGGTVLPDDYVIPMDTTNIQSNQLPTGGPYWGRVVGLRPGKPSGAGHACWIWTFQVCEGEHAAKTIDNYTYDGPGAFKFLEVKESMGFAAEDQLTIGGIRNKAIGWTMEDNFFNSKNRPRVGTVMPHYKFPAGSTIDVDPTPPSDANIPF